MPFIFAFCLAVLLTPVIARVGLILRLQDAPGELKIHPHPVPLTGGLAIVASMSAAVVLLNDKPFGFAIGGALIALALGTWDDARSLPVSVRLVAQVAIGLVVAAGLPPSLSVPLAQVAVVLLVIVTTNAVNLIDGQDGLAGGLTMIAALTLALAGGAGMDLAGLLIALAAAVGGFLVWNRPPARVFLGNGGAYAVGTLLAAGTVQTTVERGWRGFLAAGLCLGVFAFELLFTVARRLRDGSGLVAGDRGHSYDLLARTRGRAQVTIVFCLAGAVAGSLGALVARIPLIAGAIATVLAAIAGLSAASWLWPRRSNPSIDLPEGRTMEVGDKT